MNNGFLDLREVTFTTIKKQVRCESGERGELNYEKYNYNLPIAKGDRQPDSCFPRMQPVCGYLAEESRNRSIVSLANGLIAQYADGTLPFRYYTRDRLMSLEARLNWVEPDLRAIDSKIVAIGTKY